MLLVAIIRVRLADVPFERDEGEYAYAGQLILHGIPPYLQAYNMKFPGTYYAYALVMAIFGQTPRGVHLGLIVVNALTTLLVLALGRKLIGHRAGTVAAIAFAVLSLDRWIMGVFAHATHFALLPALGGLWVLMRATGPRRTLSLLAGGAMLGLAVLVKQHAFTFVPVGAFLIVRRGTDAGKRGLSAICLDLAALTAGVLLPLGILCAVFGLQGMLDKFWFWTFQYARDYITELPLGSFVPNLEQGLLQVTRATLLLWLAAGAGLISMWVGRWETTERVFLTCLLLASFLAVCPGFYFREHYFILLLPAVALLNGVAFESAGHVLARVMPAARARAVAATLFAAVTIAVLAGQRDYLFAMSPRELSRTRYGTNPFIESVEIAKYIRERTTAQDRIAVLGSEPQIYFYSDRLSATGYIYMYPLMEPQRNAARMQDEAIREIEAAHPKYVVFASIATSWLRRPESVRKIVDWGQRYVDRCYDPVGIVDIFSPLETHYAWDDEIRTYRPRSQNLVLVFRRKTDGPCAQDSGHSDSAEKR